MQARAASREGKGACLGPLVCENTEKAAGPGSLVLEVVAVQIVAWGGQPTASSCSSQAELPSSGEACCLDCSPARMPTQPADAAHLGCARRRHRCLWAQQPGPAGSGPAEAGVKRRKGAPGLMALHVQQQAFPRAQPALGSAGMLAHPHAHLLLGRPLLQAGLPHRHFPSLAEVSTLQAGGEVGAVLCVECWGLVSGRHGRQGGWALRDKASNIAGPCTRKRYTCAGCQGQ